VPHSPICETKSDTNGRFESAENNVTKQEIGTGDWIVVCDGRKALILDNIGDAKFPNLETKESYDHPDASTHEQGAAPPGRSHRSIGPARSAVTQTDWHDEAERAFLKSLAARLHRAVTTGETRALTIVASPRALGMIRENYTPAVRSALDREVAKDLVKMPIHEIESFLFKAAGV
jgi:protein required for attachment to host cells